jgi:hypothetical protein
LDFKYVYVLAFCTSSILRPLPASDDALLDDMRKLAMDAELVKKKKNLMEECYAHAVEAVYKAF